MYIDYVFVSRLALLRNYRSNGVHIIGFTCHRDFLEGWGGVTERKRKMHVKDTKKIGFVRVGEPPEKTTAEQTGNLSSAGDWQMQADLKRQLSFHHKY